MDAAHEASYRALTSRDPRFDGRFFFAVVTTGIYCRPICPAKTPRPENVRVYGCAAAAEAAGFRPCRRCRPDAAPGTPAWSGTEGTVARALREIAAGALEDPESGLASFAADLGVGERHLRRLFARHVGASPAAVARTRRVHFARKLIDETDLPLARVAFAAGFKSVRQFNETIRAAFGAPGSALRRAHCGARARPAALTLRLAYRPPFDWDGLLAYLALRATPGVEVVTPAGTYCRTIASGGASGSAGGFIEVAPARDGRHLELRVEMPGGASTTSGFLLDLAARARRAFDLDADPAPIAAHLAEDPLLARSVAARPGLRVPGTFEPFELAVRAILGQQVSVRGATTLAGRLARSLGRPLPPGSAPPGLTHLFPTPAELARADLARIGLPGARARALGALAAAVDAGALALRAPAGLEDAVVRLRAIPGIGPWTAHYVALRALGEPDAFPAADLGLRRAVAGPGGAPVSADDLARRAEAWRPWRGYAALHLWTLAPSPTEKERICK